MRQENLASSPIVLLASVGLYGQTASANPAATETASKAWVHKTYSVDPLALNLNLILPPPPRGTLLSLLPSSLNCIVSRLHAHRRRSHRLRPTITKKTFSSLTPSWDQTLPRKPYPLPPHYRRMFARLKVRQVVRSRMSIAARGLISWIAPITLSAHSTRNLLRIRAGICSPAICSPSRWCSWCPRSDRRSSPVSMSTFTTAWSVEFTMPAIPRPVAWSLTPCSAGSRPRPVFNETSQRRVKRHVASLV
jgi:hypothetical protein